MEKLRYPFDSHREVIETAQMIRTANRTFAVHTLCALVLYVGRSRLGKTTTARWITAQVNDRYAPEAEHSFRAFHYQVGAIEQWSGNEINFARSKLRGIKRLAKLAAHGRA